MPTGVTQVNFEALVRIPLDRVGVLVGREGKVKSRIEEAFGVSLVIDSKTGEISIKATKGPEEANYLRALDVTNAIARGFSPEKAFRLDDDEQVLSIMDLKNYSGKSKSHLIRIKGRIIGLEGKSRKIVEDLTGCNVSVYGDTVSLIGRPDQVKLATEAVDMLASGSNHKSVYNMLQKARSRAKMDRLGLWKGTIIEE